MTRLCAALLASAVLTTAVPAGAADLKIGFLATLSGSIGAMGQDQYDGFMLGLEQMGGKLGGKTIEVVKEDDQFKPDVGVQVAQKLISEDKVPIITGVSYSNVMMAINKKITDAGVFLIGSASGPSPMAGAACSPLFFSTSWQNDQMSEAVGKYATEKGYKKIFAMGPNFQGWKDALAGFRRYYKEPFVKELHTPLNQMDLSAEMAQIALAKPDAVFAHYAGGLGVNFIKQYRQAGLLGKIPLIVVATVDGLTLPALNETALGVMTAQVWAPDTDNAANKAFVEAFEKKYGRIPSNFAAQAYDSAKLLDVAIGQVKGDLSNKEAFAAALKNAKFESVRGKFAFNNNNFPIENFNLLEVGKDAKGRVSMVTKGVLLVDQKDAYHQECPMK
ncbi:ABC transporter substrate-binding protein [Pseudolabrys taiwanensis]|uniref:ABC transporter substrate-binding protein n=1 Tax=Pseudolabrys taiwanensis TaxID=331696 RepID=A0A346A4R8_9HYPH|nr:ABC transporter substrate-binding protein [Pseudolabrys taiwanensis]AXK84165.1 ABC transporter substrate-binding protein [Pseudolabrys taiwanensis]